MVQNIVQNIHDAIRGRDQLLPPPHPVCEEHLMLIQQAIAAETTIKIQYQAIGTIAPTWRTVQPLTLQTKENLYYLTAYCHRAEMNLTFRLDGIKEISNPTP